MRGATHEPENANGSGGTFKTVKSKKSDHRPCNECVRKTLTKSFRERERDGAIVGGNPTPPVVKLMSLLSNIAIRGESKRTKT